MEGMVSYTQAAVERAMKVQEVILRAMAKKITWWQAAEIIGISDRQMRHFHEKLQEEHQVEISYSWVKGLLQGAGMVAKGRKRGVHRQRRPRRPLPGMLLHIDGAAATISAPGSHPRRLATNRRNPPRHRCRPAHAASQTQTVRAIAVARGRAVEMTEENNPPTPRAGDYSLPWKAQTAKARFPHSHRPGC
jgi:hypothetical protein